ncbi:uncharacterized protein PHALS_14082 [Plasmopara halstedii]|uniref:Uncharacterized protein n=1 Tax=Plasmopara halstedii TaxID=4781 RepID=A0A0P1ARD2_PLAHL|nr:uncharacterized protein PHALS_14082 [Plasmopara halstedii]CEG43790.1 hypothetical protein PHALS_14082 [Plasmopara halstedii]|eukprot:XP_024580159.1 hypothetical protein PHALS_14082 [Plasmopara halstedii]
MPLTVAIAFRTLSAFMLSRLKVLHSVQQRPIWRASSEGNNKAFAVKNIFQCSQGCTPVYWDPKSYSEMDPIMTNIEFLTGSSTRNAHHAFIQIYHSHNKKFDHRAFLSSNLLPDGGCIDACLPS